jgi:17beta-estradiol 17-dehydrogenase / very-long-chain 3-oxoacyl-CoA reductase
MDLSKYTECLSQWPAHVAPGLPTFGALFLLATGGLVIACKVWTFVRVLLSLFVLPGKPVWNHYILPRFQRMKLTGIE